MRSIENVFGSHPEARLVFALAGSCAKKLAPETKDLAWPRLLSIAADENAIIALHEFYRNTQAGSLPRDIERQLAVLTLAARHRMLRLERRLGETLSVLHDAGISVTLLKGAALARTVYPSMAARPMNDLDILIDPDQALYARELLLRSGWAPDPDLPGDVAYAAHHHLPPLFDLSGTGRRLELHTSLLPRESPFQVLPNEIISDSRTVSVHAVPVRVLSPTHHALHIAIHWAWSNECGVGAWHTFRDLSTLRARGMLDFEQLVQASAEWRAATCVFWTLHMAYRLTGLTVPRGVLPRLKPRLPRAMLSSLEGHFLAKLLHHRERSPSMRVNRALWSLAIRPVQSGHGRARPWSVSPALDRIRYPRPLVSESRVLQRLRAAARGVVYLASVLRH